MLATGVAVLTMFCTSSYEHAVIERLAPGNAATAQAARACRHLEAFAIGSYGGDLLAVPVRKRRGTAPATFRRLSLRRIGRRNGLREVLASRCPQTLGTIHLPHQAIGLRRSREGQMHTRWSARPEAILRQFRRKSRSATVQV